MNPGEQNKAEYLDVVYSQERRPKTGYPFQLARYLIEKCGLRIGNLLDLGCGRGDMLDAFAQAGCTVKGADYSSVVAQLCVGHDVVQVDIMKEALPFTGSSFDTVFSKSVIEHVPDTLLFLDRARTVLSPGGKLVIMTPSWRHHGWGPFYIDFTHIRPFTAPSLRDAMTMAGYADVQVMHIRQLPFLWKHPYLEFLSSIIAALPLPYSPMYEMKMPWPEAINKYIRFSNEVMLVGVGTKPGISSGKTQSDQT